MTRSPHILIVDDDRELRQLLTAFLGRHGFRVDAAADGRAMAKLLETGRFDLIVLDLMLPGEDGLALCRRLRASSNLPVIMLTALAEETDRIVGLEMGADDYVVKPFSPRELLARIKAVLRRTGEVSDRPEGEGNILVFDGWRLDLARRELHSPDGVLMPLTGGEFDLLAAFAQHPQRVLSRDQLLDLTKGRLAGAYDRSVDSIVALAVQPLNYTWLCASHSGLMPASKTHAPFGNVVRPHQMIRRHSFNMGLPAVGACNTNTLRVEVKT